MDNSRNTKRILIVFIIFSAVAYSSVFNDPSCECKCPGAAGIDEKIVGKGNETEEVLSQTTHQPSITKPTFKTFINKSEPYHHVRLPKYVRPINYDIFLDVNLTTKDVNGTALVTVNVTMQTKYFIIHAINFKTVRAKLFDLQNNELEILRQFNYVKNQYHVIELGDKVSTGSYKLQYAFFYKLKTNLAGFYQATYKTKSGEEKMVAATQFQPVDARSAFPCFDEPAMRATFTITMAHEKKYNAISNMPIAKTWYDTSGERRYDQFGKTPSMPTYLLAFVIGEFVNVTVTAKTRKPVQMSYFAPEEMIDQIKYAVKVGSVVLPFFEKYYNVSYPLPKADMIALPDLEASAMENWGLMTYRLKILLYDEVASSISNKVSTASVISHELAHQWFGNIVTMDWWSDLWLNEGFASYVEYLGVNATHPEWNYVDFQVIYDVVSGLHLDAMVTSHPIYIEVENPSQISEIFDPISYNKGAAILRMLDNFLGTENFVKGLNSYLRKYSYGTAKTADLWKELSKASRLAGDNYNVSEIMNTWVLQMGFPVINVTRKENGVYHLTQSRFLRDVKPNLNTSEFVSPYGYKWVVPFNYFTLDISNASNVIPRPVKKLWINMTDAYIDVGSNDLIIKGNAGLYGFFRVNYDDYGWKNLISIMKNDHTIFDVKDRAGLLQDSFALASSGRLNYTTALDLFDYIHKETDYIPWETGRNSISDVRGLLSKSDNVLKLFKKYMLLKVNDLYMKYEFRPVDKFLDRKLQILATSVACNNRHKSCLQRASEMFKDWMVTGKQVSNNYRTLVYYYGVYNGGEKEWNFVFNKYLRTTVASEKGKLLYALSATRDPGTVDRFLYYTLDEKVIRMQDVDSVFRYVSNGNSQGRYHTWYFLKENWAVLEKKFANSLFTIRHIIGDVVSGFTTEHDLKKVSHFYNTRLKKTVQSQRIIKQSLEQITSNIEWIRANKHLKLKIQKWLKTKLESSR